MNDIMGAEDATWEELAEYASYIQGIKTCDQFIKQDFTEQIIDFMAQQDATQSDGEEDEDVDLQTESIFRGLQDFPV